MPSEPHEPVWQGRLATKLDPRARALNDSLPVDSRLVGEELALSRAYATTLAECGIMTEIERDALIAACDSLEADLGVGLAKLDGEEVHSAVEAALARRRYDRASLATRLGFSRVAINSLDAVGDRDFAVQYLHAAALLGVHLSRLSEDLVLFCSPAFGWFTAPDGFSTGSSLLPQKRNPDLFELARGKSARLLANAQQLATLLKGLPSSYQKDLQ